MTAVGSPPLHPGAEPLAFLLGTWRGAGDGRFHHVDPFPFEEEIRFSHRGRPWIVYEQRAWSPGDEELLHTEMGFWRPLDEGTVAIFTALTAGTELAEGRLDGTSIELEASSTPMAEGIERVDRLRRTYVVDGDAMRYEVFMGTSGQPYDRHVTAELRRVGPVGPSSVGIGT